MSYDGRRAGPRQHDLRVAVTVQTESEEFSATLLDAGARGAFVQTEEVVPPGAAVKVGIQIDGHDVFLSGQTVRNAFAGTKGPGFALEFDLDATAIIDRLAASNAAERR